jgi:electron transfer flavoprotein beta subunit
MLSRRPMAEVIESEGCDLVLAGVQSDDFSNAQIGTLLAELLGFPHATIVMEIQADPSSGTVKALREMESGSFQWVQTPLPAVLTVQAGISQIRYASLKGIMQAKKKEIRRIPAAELSLELHSVPRLEVLRLYFPESDKKAEILEGDTEKVVAELVDRLRKEARVL